MYKRMNQRREGYDPMGEPIRERLAEFYVDSNKALAAQLPDRELPNWLA
jgi:hypothetical protein